MKFCEYLKILNCYIGEEKSQFEFMCKLFSLFVNEPYTDEEIARDENDNYYPFSNLCGEDISKKVYKGDRVLPKATARFMISHFNKRTFVDRIEEMDDAVRNNLCSQLSSYGIKCDIDNISDVASDCFYSFLEAALDENDTVQTGLSASAEIRAENNGTTNQDTLLLLEVGNKCPLCGETLMLRNGKEKNIKRYKITQIFPDNVSKELYLAFGKHSRPCGNYNHPDNLIALCAGCSTDYLSEPTEEEFLRILKIKKVLQQNQKIQQDLTNINIEEEIQHVVNGLVNINDTGKLVELRMDALKISQKIEPKNALLIDSVTHDVIRYYSFIEDLFAEIDERKTGTFTLIASEMRQAYLKITTQGAFQNETFRLIEEWLSQRLDLGKRYSTAVRIVVSFFVQNCEVFDEISK